MAFLKSVSSLLLLKIWFYVYGSILQVNVPVLGSNSRETLNLSDEIKCL